MMKLRRVYSLMLLRSFCLKQIERTTVGRKQQRAELSLTLDAEMLHGQMVDFHNDIDNFAQHSEAQITSRERSSSPNTQLILRNGATSSNMNFSTTPKNTCSALRESC